MFKNEIKNRKKLKPACSLPGAGDRNNIILEVPRSNHKERDKFKDNVIKKTIWVKKKSTFAW